MIIGSIILLGLIWVGLTWIYKKFKNFFVNFSKQISMRREKRSTAKLEVVKTEEISDENI